MSKHGFYRLSSEDEQASIDAAIAATSEWRNGEFYLVSSDRELLAIAQILSQHLKTFKVEKVKTVVIH